MKPTDGEKIGKWAWKQVVFILGANLAFGILLGGLPSIGVPAMGMIIAIYALVIIASLAGHEFKLPSVLVLATVLAVGSYVAFIWALEAADPGLADLHHRLRTQLLTSWNWLNNLSIGFRRRRSRFTNLLYCLRRLHSGHADRRAAGHRPGRDHRDAAARHLRAAAGGRR